MCTSSVSIEELPHTPGTLLTRPTNLVVAVPFETSQHTDVLCVVHQSTFVLQMLLASRELGEITTTTTTTTLAQIVMHVTETQIYMLCRSHKCLTNIFQSCSALAGPPPQPQCLLLRLPQLLQQKEAKESFLIKISKPKPALQI